MHDRRVLKVSLVLFNKPSSLYVVNMTLDFSIGHATLPYLHPPILSLSMTDILELANSARLRFNTET